MSLAVGLLVALIACGAIVFTKTRMGIIATALLCMGANAYLFSRKLASSTGPSLCNINEIFNCDLVNSSEASMAFGMPITLFGIAFYLGLSIAGGLAKDDDDTFFRVNTGFAVVSVIYSIYLAYVSKTIGAACVMCISIYVGNAILLWGGIKGLKETGKGIGDNLPGTFTGTSFVVIVGTFLVGLLVGQSYWASQAGGPSRLSGEPGTAQPKPTPVNPAEANTNKLSQLYQQPRGVIKLDGTEAVYGNPSAPYMIVEWADYGCPHCAMAAKELKQLVAMHPEVQVRFKTFPLTGACNPVIEHDGGPERCKAAMSVECAGEQDKFWEMNTMVFNNQGFMADENLTFMAKEVGLDMDRFATCMNNPATVAGIQQDAVAGAEAGVQGTPALFLKGTHGDAYIDITQGPEAVLMLVEAHLAGVKLPPAGPPRAPQH